MVSGARFIAQFFPLFLLGALFGKLMDDSGSVQAIARFMTDKLGARRAMLAVVLAGALVTYGGVSLFVAFFVLVPMAQALFREADIPHRLMPAAIVLGTSTFTMSALPGTPAIQNAIPMPFFGTTPFAAPGLGIIASAIMIAFGLWWLGFARKPRRGEGRRLRRRHARGRRAGRRRPARARARHDRARVRSGGAQPRPAQRTEPTIVIAALPLVVVVLMNLLMTPARAAAARPRVPRGGAMGTDQPRRRGRRVVGGGGAGSRRSSR